MMLTLTFRLQLHSDYHVGSGHGIGPTLDSALPRDHDRALLLRGSILAGLLRDGLEDLRRLKPMLGIDRTALDAASERLFGSEAQRKRWAYASARAAASSGGHAAGRWGAQDVTRIRISPRTRRAAPQQLFTQEEGDLRALFTFTATCPFPTAQDERDAALLIAAARMVRHLGAARRRGRGECEITMEKATGLPGGAEWTQDQALEAFKAGWFINTPAADTPAVAPQAPPELDGPRVRLRLVARTVEPVIVAKRSEAGNVYEGLLSIPGTTLLGALANRAAKKLGLRLGETAPEEFVKLFFRGGIRVTSLVPAEHDQQNPLRLYPAIHAPLDIFACEAHPLSHPLGSFALRTDLPEKCSKCGADLIPVSKLAPLLKLYRRPIPHKPPRREEAHIRLNRETGRVRTGDLYEYAALEAGQWLTGELDCANETCWQRLQALTGLAEEQAVPLRLGKASQRGYGLVTCVLTRLNDTAPSPWTLRPLEQRIVSASEPFSLLLLTDAIITDAWGRYEHSFDQPWVAQILQLEPEQISLRGQYGAARIVDTFNASRRAPRWRDEAIVAGSAAGIAISPEGLQSLVAAWRIALGQMPMNSAVSDELAALRWRLTQIEATGIGLRTMEGFGRVVFNHPVYAPLADGCLEDGVMAPDLPEFHPPSDTGQLVAEALFRRDYQAQLLSSELHRVEEERLGWEALSDESFETVARFLFLSRRHDAVHIKRQLQQLTDQEQLAQLPSFLWNKVLPGRSKESKLDGHGVDLICRLIDELQQIDNLTPADRRWAIGLEILAARIAEHARKGMKR